MVIDVFCCADCDLNPNLLTTGLNLSLLDMNFDGLDVPPAEVDIITIDDTTEESVPPSAKFREDGDGKDLEIIRVKLLNPPKESNSDIEMLSDILNPTEVIELMQNQIKHIENVTEKYFSMTTMRLVMSKYNWHGEFLTNLLLDTNIDAILKSLNIVISHELKTNTKRRKLRYSSQLQSQISRYFYYPT